jgi:predicted nucleotidyltransferase
MRYLFFTKVGSHYHQTSTPTSDVDIRAVYALSLREKLSPFIEATQIKLEGDDSVAYELSHFARMLAKGNPTAIEVAMSAIDCGSPYPASTLLSNALDTEKFVSQCNGFVKGMWHDGKPKALHHGWRVALLCRRYILTGELDFDCTSYPEYEDLMRVKFGLLAPSEEWFAKQEPQHIHHVQDIVALEDTVYELYTRA